MAFMAPKMALWALLGASRTCPEASPERPWAPRGHQNRFLTAILVAWDALGLVFGVRFGRFWRPAMLLTGRFVTPTLQPCTRPYTSAAPKKVPLVYQSINSNININLNVNYLLVISYLLLVIRY